MTDYNPKIEDIADVIQDLNYEIEKQWNPHVSSYGPCFELQSDGFSVIVNFMGIEVFGECTDERKHNEEDDTYEDFKEYLKRRASEFIVEVSNIRL